MKGGKSRARGFSLAEVVLAIGIASFSLLVIFSLIPLGLGVVQDTGRQMIGTEIFNKIESELVSTPFYTDSTKTTDVLDGYLKSRYPLYFDTEGNELSGSQAPGAVFTATCVLTDLPSGTAEAGELRFVTVNIAVNTHVEFSRTFLLANKGN